MRPACSMTSLGEGDMDSQAFASASEYIDLQSISSGQAGFAGYAKIVSDAAAQLADDGCCVLKGFIRQQALPDLVRQADLVAPRAHRSFNRTNPYFSEDDPDLPATDPRRRFMTVRMPLFRPTILGPRRVFVPSMNMTRSSFHKACAWCGQVLSLRRSAGRCHHQCRRGG